MRRLVVRGVLGLVLTLVHVAALPVAAQDATPAALEGTPVAGPPGIPDPAGSDLPLPTADGEYRVALLVPFPDDPFWIDVKLGASYRAEQLGIKLDVYELTGPSVPEQLQQVDSALESGVQGIILGPVDQVGIVPAVAKANDAGVPIVAVDTAPLTGEIASVVRTDSYAVARAAASLIGETLQGEGSVLNLQGDLSTDLGRELDAGFRDGINEFGGIKLTSADGSWVYGTAYGATYSQLPQAEAGTPTPPEPLIDAVFAANAAMTLGAADAVESVQADTVKVFGYGATDETITAVRNGIVAGLFVEFPSRAGILAVDQLVRALNGDTVESVVDSGFALVTSESLFEYVSRVDDWHKVAADDPSAGP